jgi:thiamine biosynthesis lipoprotein ApbE
LVIDYFLLIIVTPDAINSCGRQNRMGKRNRHILMAGAATCLVTALYFFAGRAKQVEADSGHRLVMGTFARVVAIATDSKIADKAIEAALAEIESVDKLMSDYKSDSEISQVNREGFARAVKVSRPTYEVLQRSIEFSKLTGGAFDITVGPLVDLWRSAKKKSAIPTEEELAAAKAKVGFEKLILDDEQRTVRFAVEGMRLDLGAIGKGYAVDKAIEAAQRAGALGAMVDLGGHIRCFGKPPKGKTKWSIGLQNPNVNKNTDESDLLLVLKLDNAAVATSGDYQQFVLIEGKRYSHIINRRTGAGAEGLSSVTIIADNATDADALATAVSVMGQEKGLALIETIVNAEAILVTSAPQYDLVKTKGAEEYLK